MNIIETIKEHKNIDKNITHLTFEHHFNQQTIIPQNITHLTFGCQRHSVFFEKKIGYHFNQQIIIPQNIIYLTFRDDFNKKIKISQNITKKAQLFFVG